MTWKAAIATSVALIAALPAFADRVFPPQSESDVIDVPPTVGRDRVRELRLGAYLVRFEKTPLAEVRAKLGAGDLERAGDVLASWAARLAGFHGNGGF